MWWVSWALCDLLDTRQGDADRRLLDIADVLGTEAARFRQIAFGHQTRLTRGLEVGS
jgi:hypothetical protein